MEDLRTVIDKDCSLNILTASDPEGLKVLRHTTSHILAEAVKRLFPEAKVTIGPAIEDGFTMTLTRLLFPERIWISWKRR